MLEATLNEYVFDTENPILNYRMGIEYEKLGQTASAISYFLRASERTDDKLLQYECLIRLGHCFDRQQNRFYTVKSMYRRAISVMPDRPEAYYFLAKSYSWESNYSETYIICLLAYHNCKGNTYSDLNVNYPGLWGIDYHYALSSWWYGLSHQSKDAFETLKRDYWNVMDQYHKNSINSNLTMIYEKMNIKPPKKMIVDYFTFYAPTMKEMLRLRLHMLKDYVDEFVIAEANKTHSGVPVEYQLENILREFAIPNLNVKILKVEIPEDEKLEVTEIDVINSGSNASNINTLRAKVRERMCVNAILSLLNHYDDDTAFILSDADEIVKPDFIEYIANIARQNLDCVIRIPMVHLEGRADLRLYDRDSGAPMEWTGAIITTKKHLMKAAPNQMRCNIHNPFPIRFITENGAIVQDLGWHFSSMGGKEIIKLKYSVFSHYDDVFNTSLIPNKFASKEKMDYIDNMKFVEGEYGPSAEKNRILKKYPIENLPKIIFELPSVEKYLFPTGSTSSKDDTKHQIEKIFPEYDIRYNHSWGWASLSKAGCLVDYVDEICKHVDNPVCVEIGVFAGKSVLPMALELKRNKKGIIYAIDPWTNEEATKGYDGINYDYWNNINLNHALQIFETMISEFDLKDHVEIIKDTSNNAPLIENIDLLHIDGQHTEQAIFDAKKYAPQIVQNGFCVVDDVEWGEVSQVPELLERMGFVAIHSVDGCVIFKKVCVRTEV